MAKSRDFNEVINERIARIESAQESMAGTELAKAVIESADVLIREAANQQRGELNEWLDTILMERPRERRGVDTSFSLDDVLNGMSITASRVTVVLSVVTIIAWASAIAAILVSA